VPREFWLLLTASGSVPMFSLQVAARIVCCFAAVPQHQNQIKKNLRLKFKI
jgi:hypothetical protein